MHGGTNIDQGIPSGTKQNVVKILNKKMETTYLTVVTTSLSNSSIVI
jgi:hypothetical protein